MESNSTVDDEPSLSRVQVLAGAGLFEGGMLVVAIGVAWVAGVDLMKGVVFSVSTAAWACAFTVPLLIGLYGASRVTWPMVEPVRRDLDLVMPLFRNCTVFDLLLISLIAGVGEEALFRGVLQPLAAGWVGAIPALLAVSVLFGVAHYLSHSYAIYATGMGLYLGAIQLWTGNLFVAAAVHALYDFVALVYLVRLNVR